MKTDRRSFLSGACALGVGVLAVAKAKGEGEGRRAKLKIGLLSDIHLETPENAERLEKAFEWFRDRHVDGVLICGDLADHGIEAELKMLADSWKKVFPGDKLPDGSHVERLFHYGDHDTGGYAHRKEFFGSGDRLMKRYGITYEELCAQAIREKRAEIWERTFGEKWQPIFLKQVKGYDFVLANWNPDKSNGGNMTPGLDKFFESYRPDPTKPFFHSQHRVYRNTAGGPMTWGQDDGSTGKLLAKYPNCLAFCGHGHLSATSELAIWQGAFSAIEVPSLRYVGFPGDHENKSVSELRTKAGIPAQMAKLQVYQSTQGMMMTVYEDSIEIDRIDFSAKDALAPKWTIPLDRRQLPYARAEQRSRSVAPQFPKGAKLTVKKVQKKAKDGKVTNQIDVGFPLAQPTATTPRAFDYEVTVTSIQTGGAAMPVTHRVYSPRAFDAPSRDLGPGNCVFSYEEFPDKAGTFYVCAYPCDTFGTRGEPLEAEVKL